MPIRPDHYPGGKEQCPTSQYWGGEFHGDDICPMYLQFDERLIEKFQEFTEVDLLRMVRKRIRRFVHLEEMIAQGVMLKFFPLHKWRKLRAMHEAGWCRISCGTIFTYPGYISHGADAVRNYFGEEVG